jgi:hypothetical protein
MFGKRLVALKSLPRRSITGGNTASLAKELSVAVAPARVVVKVIVLVVSSVIDLILIHKVRS